MIFERIFSSVLLPAPLRPMMPTTSPSSTLKETLRSAQRISLGARWRNGRAQQPHQLVAQLRLLLQRAELVALGQILDGDGSP